MGDSHWFEVIVKLANSNAGAILIEYEGAEIWVPRSQILDHEIDLGEVINENYEGEETAIELPHWFAKQRGMLE